MKRSLFVLIILLLLGCRAEYETALPAKSGNQSFDVICIDNVEYIYFAKYGDKVGYLAPHFKTDGSLYICTGLPGGE